MPALSLTARCAANWSRRVYPGGESGWDGIEAYCSTLGLECRKFTANGTQCVHVRDDRTAVLAFRGTDAVDGAMDWFANVDHELVDAGRGTKSHRGFQMSLNAVWDDVLESVREWRLLAHVFTGHSKGAAEITQCVWRLRLERVLPDSWVGHTFGSPRVGGTGFAKEFTRAAGARWVRWQNCADLVTHVPLPFKSKWLDAITPGWIPITGGYRHVGTLRYFDRRGDVHKDWTIGQQWRDQLVRIACDFGRPRAAGTKDHSMVRYEELVGRCAA